MRTEARLHSCTTPYSEERAFEGIAIRFAPSRASCKLHEGLSRPRTRKDDSSGSASGKGSRMPRRRTLHRGRPDPHSGKAVVTRKPKPLAGTMLTHPGVYCLRSNVHDWDPQTLWRTCTMDLEAVFRSLKSELGLRPIFHKTQNRPFTVTWYCHRLPMVQTIAGASPTERTPLDSASPRPACHRLLPPKGRSHPPRPQGHPAGATPTQNLHRSRFDPHPEVSPN